MSFDGKGATVMITGCSSGIGRATAELAKRSGFKVIGLDINAPADGLVDKFVQADLSSGEGIDKAIKDLSAAVQFNDKESFYLVNNAGYQNTKYTALNMPRSEEQKILHVCQEAPYELCRWFVNSIHALGRKPVDASVVNIGSVQVVGRAYGPQSKYSVCKTAVHGITKTFAQNAAQLGVPVRLNTVHPGTIATEGMGAIHDPAVLQPLVETNPLDRRGRPEEVAEAILTTLNNTYLNMAEMSVTGGVEHGAVGFKYAPQGHADGDDPDAWLRL